MTLLQTQNVLHVVNTKQMTTFYCVVMTLVLRSKFDSCPTFAAISPVSSLILFLCPSYVRDYLLLYALHHLIPINIRLHIVV